MEYLRLPAPRRRSDNQPISNPSLPPKPFPNSSTPLFLLLPVRFYEYHGAGAWVYIHKDKCPQPGTHLQSGKYCLRCACCGYFQARAEPAFFLPAETLFCFYAEVHPSVVYACCKDKSRGLLKANGKGLLVASGLCING